ncbi:MAG: ERF family protein [Pseudomonadota bacterium]|nr:ERF family protein [Pseudomonadota bacterium]
MTQLNIHQRLHAAMQKVDYIQKEKRSGMQYSIVTHDAVTAKVRPVLLECGIVYHPVEMKRSQDGNRTEVDLVVRFSNIDNPSDHIDVPACGYGIDSQDKGPGKAISYAVKYALLKALGLETGDDPDQDQNATHQKAEPQGHLTAEAARIAGLLKTCASEKQIDALLAGEGGKLAQLKEKRPELYDRVILRANEKRDQFSTLGAA